MVNKLPKYEYNRIHLPRFITESESMFNDLAKDMWEIDKIFIYPSPQSFCARCTSQDKEPSPLFAIMKRQLG